MSESIVRIDQRAAAEYVLYLKASFLVKTLYNFSRSRFISERNLKKIYLSSTNFIYQLSPQGFNDPSFLGRAVEDLVVAQSDSDFFWSDRNREVDIILKDDIPLEVKYSNTVEGRGIKGVVTFCRRFRRSKAIILTKTKLDEKEVNGHVMHYIPIWLYLLKE